MTDDIMFNEFETSDKVLIRTRNSVYRFSIDDPKGRQGRLAGGRFGDDPRQAVLVESMVEEGGGMWGDVSGLKVGARALFFLQSPAGIERVVTSEILGLTVLKGNHSQPSLS
jgi:hypothetical protein